jgi:hypothetical protein
MSSEEADWESVLDEPPPRPGMPRWVLYGCGCGCLVTVLIAVLLLVLGVRVVGEATDAELQWPRLAEILPYDEVPFDLDLEVGFGFSAMENYTLVNQEAGYTASVLSVEVHSEQDVDIFMIPESQGVLSRLGQPVDGRPGELEIQGRVVRTLSFRKTRVPVFGDKLGPGVRVDLSGGGRAILVDFRRTSSQEPFRDEELLEFFDYFDVWRGR